MDAPLLKIENLRTYSYSRAKRAFIRSVDDVSLSLARGETLGVVGERGSGKRSRTTRTSWESSTLMKRGR